MGSARADKRVREGPYAAAPIGNRHAELIYSGEREGRLVAPGRRGQNADDRPVHALLELEPGARAPTQPRRPRGEAARSKPACRLGEERVGNARPVMS